jgi:hypothetical protein
MTHAFLVLLCKTQQRQESFFPMYDILLEPAVTVMNGLVEKFKAVVSSIYTTV